MSEEGNEDSPLRRPRHTIKRVTVVSDTETDSDSSVAPPATRRKRLRVLSDDGSDSSGSSIVLRRRRTLPKLRDSDGDSDTSGWATDHSDAPRPASAGAASDSSDGNSDKCSICLLRFRDQEVGTPQTCEHIFCLDCIIEWSRNVNTCPVDRMTFTSIVVRACAGGRVLRTEPVKVPERRPSVELLVEEDPTPCEICRSTDNEETMLLCDSCDLGYHMQCLTPPLTEVPTDEWHCPNCDILSVIRISELDDLFNDIVDLEMPHGPRPTPLRMPRQVRRSGRSLTSEDRPSTSSGRTERRSHEAPSTSRGSRVQSSSSRARTSTRSRAAGTKRRKRRRTTKTVIIEYELEENGKFPITKTVKRKVKKRKSRKRPRTAARRAQVRASVRERLRGLDATALSQQSGCSAGVRQLGEQRRRAGLQPLSLFGDAHSLDYFSDEDDVAEAEGGITVAARPTSSVLSAYRQARRKRILIPSPPHASSAPDLLDSILESQTLLHSKKSIVSIAVDGKVDIKIQSRERPKKEERKEENSGKVDLSKGEDAAKKAPAYPGRGGGGQGGHGGWGGGYRGSYHRDHGTGNFSRAYENNYQPFHQNNMNNSMREEDEAPGPYFPRRPPPGPFERPRRPEPRHGFNNHVHSAHNHSMHSVHSQHNHGFHGPRPEHGRYSLGPGPQWPSRPEAPIPSRHSFGGLDSAPLDMRTAPPPIPVHASSNITLTPGTPIAPLPAPPVFSFDQNEETDQGKDEEIDQGSLVIDTDKYDPMDPTVDDVDEDSTDDPPSTVEPLLAGANPSPPESPVSGVNPESPVSMANLSPPESPVSGVNPEPPVSGLNPFPPVSGGNLFPQESLNSGVNPEPPVSGLNPLFPSVSGVSSIPPVSRVNLFPPVSGINPFAPVSGVNLFPHDLPAAGANPFSPESQVAGMNPDPPVSGLNPCPPEPPVSGVNPCPPEPLVSGVNPFPSEPLLAGANPPPPEPPLGPVPPLAPPPQPPALMAGLLAGFEDDFHDTVLDTAVRQAIEEHRGLLAPSQPPASDDDSDGDCPNFSIYSATSVHIANSGNLLQEPPEPQINFIPEPEEEEKHPSEPVSPVESPIEHVESPIEFGGSPIEPIESSIEPVESAIEPVERPIVPVESASEPVENPMAPTDSAEKNTEVKNKDEEFKAKLSKRCPITPTTRNPIKIKLTTTSLVKKPISLYDDDEFDEKDKIMKKNKESEKFGTPEVLGARKSDDVSDDKLDEDLDKRETEEDSQNKQEKTPEITEGVSDIENEVASMENEWERDSEDEAENKREKETAALKRGAMSDEDDDNASEELRANSRGLREKTEKSVEKMTESISETEDERSYTPCLDENKSKDNSFETDKDKNLEGLDTEMISEEEGNDIFSDAEKLPSEAATPLLADEEGEIVEKKKEDDGKKRKKKESKKEAKDKRVKKKPDVPFKKITKSGKERNYRDKKDKEREEEEAVERKRRKEKRKDLERYDVRTVVTEKRNKVKDPFGRDVSPLPSPSPRPLHRRRSLSPRRRSMSPRRRSNSLRRRSISPRRRSISPRRRSISPRRRSMSPPPLLRRKSISPRRKSISPRRRSISPRIRRTATPRRVSLTPRQKSISPRRKSISPRRRSPRRSISVHKTKALRKVRKSASPRRKRGTRRRRSASRGRKRRRLASPSPKTKTLKKKKRRALSPPPKKIKRKRTKRVASPSPVSSPPRPSGWSPPSVDSRLLSPRTPPPVPRHSSRQQRPPRHLQPPAKEVFTSGDNILVSVSFNEEERDRDMEERRRRRDSRRERRRQRRRAADAETTVKPVAIIDLERSPFAVIPASPHQVIILSDVSEPGDKEQARPPPEEPPEPPVVPSAPPAGPKTPPEPEPEAEPEAEDTHNPPTPDAYDPFEPTHSPSPQHTPPHTMTLETAQKTNMSADDVIDRRPISPIEKVMALLKSTRNVSPEPPPSESQQETDEKAAAAALSSSTSTAGVAVTPAVAPAVVSAPVLAPPAQTPAPAVAPPVRIVLPSPTRTQPKLFLAKPSPIKSNPVKPMQATKISRLPMPVPVRSGGDSPYSPGSSDFGELFSPPGGGGGGAGGGPRGRRDPFDSLVPEKTRRAPRGIGKPSKKKSKMHVGVQMSEDSLKILDELPSSAVEMEVKSKFLKKLNRQERVVEEVKLVLKPHYNRKRITKDQYKQIMRRAVPKICHNKTGEINPTKIQALVEAYVKRFRKRNKLGLPT